MSVPISACMIVKAMKNKGVYAALVSRLATNLKAGHMTLGGCDHMPKCYDGIDMDEGGRVLAQATLDARQRNKEEQQTKLNL
jgi:hypothetical protein